MKIKVSVSPNFYFSDQNFINYLVKSFGQSFETSEITEIDCSACDITSLNGVEIFCNLRKLLCNDNLISDMDLLSLKNLEELQCRNNKLTKLNLSLLTNLQLIDCRNNDFSESSDILLSQSFNGLILK